MERVSQKGMTLPFQPVASASDKVKHLHQQLDAAKLTNSEYRFKIANVVYLVDAETTKPRIAAIMIVNECYLSLLVSK